MKVGLLIVTHDGVGRALLDAAAAIFGSLPIPTEAVTVASDADPDAALREARAARSRVDGGHGVLVLCDLYGSTPCNVASRVAGCSATRLVAGLNLPMLVRVFNYPRLDLDALARAALEGGRGGVVGPDPVPRTARPDGGDTRSTRELRGPS